MLKAIEACLSPRPRPRPKKVRKGKEELKEEVTTCAEMFGLEDFPRHDNNKSVAC